MEEQRAKQEYDEHALWQPGGFQSALKILVISESQTLGLWRPDINFNFVMWCSTSRPTSVPQPLRDM